MHMYTTSAIPATVNNEPKDKRTWTVTLPVDQLQDWPSRAQLTPKQPIDWAEYGWYVLCLDNGEVEANGPFADQGTADGFAKGVTYGLRMTGHECNSREYSVLAVAFVNPAHLLDVIVSAPVLITKGQTR